MLVTGKDLKGLNSILSDCFSLLPIVLGLFYKPSYIDHLCVWNPGGFTGKSSHFLCENSKFSHRTMSPVDHKLLSQNKFIMPSLYNRHGKSNVLQCHTFSCKNYPMQTVNIHISLSFPNGRILIHKCSTGLSAGPFRTPLTDARDQFPYKFFVYNTLSLSAASSPKGPSSAPSESTPRQFCPSLP